MENISPEQANQALSALDACLKDIQTKQSAGVNIFDAVGMRTQEVKHSAFLAWLLDAHRPHGLKADFLKHFIRELIVHRAPDSLPETYQTNKTILAERGIATIEDVADFLKADDLTVVTEKVVHNKESRIDIFVESQSAKTVLVIENKVFTTTHNNQLARYEEELSDRADWRKIFVYLTPLGDAPYDFEKYEDHWCVCSYSTILRIAREIAKELPKNKQASKLKYLLEDYIDMVDTNILKGNKELRALCKRIRKEYADAIELLLAYTDNAEAVNQYAAEWLKRTFPDICFATNAPLRTDFYTKRAQEYFPDIKNARIGYKLLYRITATNGPVTALAFMEKAADEPWTEKQLHIAQKCLGQAPSSEKYCTLFTLPILDEDDRAEELDTVKERIDDGLRQFKEKIMELEMYFE